MKKVGILSFMHESNGFSRTRTGLEDFQCRSGGEVIEEWADSSHEIGGMLEALPELGLRAVPLLSAVATPSGPVTRDAFETIMEKIVNALQECSIDGLLLSLHGAMLAQHLHDPDGEVVSRVRDTVGPGLPVVLTLDLHANLSARMMRGVTAATAYRTNPHLDQRDRGVEAAAIVARILRGEIQPVQALCCPPLLINILAQNTGEEPLRELFRLRDAIHAESGIVTASILLGFPYVDVEKMGASFLVVADRDTRQAEKAVARLAQAAWSLRHNFDVCGVPVDEAVRQAGNAKNWPVTLLDVGDNVGGGSAADSTVIFASILRQGVPDALVVLYDPQAVQECIATGVGQVVHLQVGAKTDDQHGKTLTVDGVVKLLHDGHFEEHEVRHGGRRYYDQGATAVVETAAGHTIVLTSLRMPPFSLEQIRCLGVRPESKRVLIAKGAIAPRAAYSPVSSSIIEVDSPGITAPDPRHLTFSKRRRPMFPFEPETEFRPSPEKESSS